MQSYKDFDSSEDYHGLARQLTFTTPIKATPIKL